MREANCDSCTITPAWSRATIRMKLRSRWVQWYCISPWNFPLAIFGQIAAARAGVAGWRWRNLPSRRRLSPPQGVANSAKRRRAAGRYISMGRSRAPQPAMRARARRDDMPTKWPPLLQRNIASRLVSQGCLTTYAKEFRETGG